MYFFYFPQRLLVLVYNFSTGDVFNNVISSLNKYQNRILKPQKDTKSNNINRYDKQYKKI